MKKESICRGKKIATFFNLVQEQISTLNSDVCTGQILSIEVLRKMVSLSFRVVSFLSPTSFPPLGAAARTITGLLSQQLSLLQGADFLHAKMWTPEGHDSVS